MPTVLRKAITTGFLILVIFKSLCQSSDIKFIPDVVIGKNHLLNKNITGNEFIFPYPVFKVDYDTTNNLFITQLKELSKNQILLGNNGFLVVYDHNNHEIKLNTEVDLTDIMYSQGCCIEKFGSKYHFYGLEDGEKKWSTKHDIYYIDQHTQIALSYGYSNNLIGIDLNKRSDIWNREVNREYGWNNVVYLNDYTLIIIADGLYTINLYDGTGWNYNTRTGDKDYTGTVVKNAAGVAIGLLTGTYWMSTGYDLVHNISSDIVIGDTNIYFASKECISCLDLVGNIRWSYQLPNNLASKSDIFIKNDMVYMINKGYAFRNSRQIYYGKPFIASLNHQDGKLNFMNIISDDNVKIEDFRIDGDTLLLLFKNKIAKYSAETGGAISEGYFDMKKDEELIYFVSEHEYLQINDSVFKELVFTDTTNYFLYDNQDKVWIIDRDFKIQSQIDINELYFHYLSSNGYEFIGNDNETIVINKDNLMVARLKVSTNSTLIGSILYNVQNRSIIATDLKELFGYVTPQ